MIKEIKYKDVPNMAFFFIGDETSKADFMKLRLTEDCICMDSTLGKYQKNERGDFEPNDIVKIKIN